MNYFIGDMHFGHSNIIRLNNRPFSSVEEMDETIISNWNSRVRPEDTVYILGDFSYRSVGNPCDILDKLKGRKVLIEGNHDFKNLKNFEFRKRFVEVKSIMSIVENSERIILCHYPMLEWDGYFRGSWHIHGHIHNNVSNKCFGYLLNEPNALNAGVDVTNFMPVTFNELKDLNRRFKESFGKTV